MLDYSLSKEESKKFIKYYQSTSGALIIHYGSGDTYTIPNNETNKERVEGKMKNQVLLSNEEAWYSKYQKAINWACFDLCVLLLCMTLVVLECGFFFTVLAGLIGMDTVYHVFKTYKNRKTLMDIKKHREFLENEEELYEETQKNKYIFAETKKNKKILVQELRNNHVFTLNMIDKMSYDDLKKILNNIQRNKEMDLANAVEEEKPKQFVK